MTIPRRWYFRIMLALLALLGCGCAHAADPDDDTVPLSAPAVHIAPAVHHAAMPAPESPFVKVVAPVTPAADPDPIRDGYPESAHKAFAARHAYDTLAKTWVPVHLNQCFMGPTPLSELQNAYIQLYVDCFNSWFSKVENLPVIADTDSANYQLRMLTATARGAVIAHTWPCWTWKDGSYSQLLKMAYLIERHQGPDWLRDMMESNAKATYRTN